MLKLNEPCWMIVDQDRCVEYDYDGPCISHDLNDPWLSEVLDALQKSEAGKYKKYQIVKVVLRSSGIKMFR